MAHDASRLQFVANSDTERTTRSRFINGNRLEVARLAMEMSQSQLASLAGISQAHVSNLEAGVSVKVSDSTVERISQILRVAPSFLFMARDLDPVVLHYRKKKGMRVALQRSMEAQVAMAFDVISDLNSGTASSNLLHQYPTSDGAVSASDVARKVRDDLGVGTGPVDDLVSVVEQAEVFVIPFRFDDLSVDGLAAWLNDQTPVIFYNPCFSPDRIRLNIAHELGHLVMHRGRVCLGDDEKHVEGEAFDFGVRFLYPPFFAQQEMNPRLSLSSLAEMKVKWKISMQALIRYARDLGIIDEGWYKYLYIQISRMGFRKQEPFNDGIRVGQPLRLKHLLDRLCAAGSSIERIAQSVSWPKERFQQTFIQNMA